MQNYLMVIIATILLAFDFALSKQYQKKWGTSPSAGLTFNALNGFLSAIIFWILNGFHFSFSIFSILMAFCMSLFIVTYSMIGFRILALGNMAMYTLFLMIGGMVLPYIWGVIFLEEALTPARVIGLVLVLGAIILSNAGGKKPDKQQLVLCFAVFFLNGLVSIFSKMHQIDTVHHAVSSTEFVMLAGITKFILCSITLFVYKKKLCSKPCAEYSPEDSTPKVKKIFLLVLCSAFLSGLSYMLQLLGAKNLPATVLYPIITGGSIFFSAFAGKIFFREKITTYQWASIALCFVGTCLFLEL